MKTKILSLILISLFLGSTIIPSITSSSIDNKLLSLDDNNQCYGFIVPIVKLENKSLENDIDCRIHNMVNDFLREELTVYWAAENFTTSVLKIHDAEEQDMFFEKGTFIIPFTENDTVNTKICAIICDYNQTSEIEDAVSIPTYQLMESLEIKAYKLSEVKIARYNGCRVHPTQFYLMIANQCGFLNFDLIAPKNIQRRLTNNNFNVIIWPGAELSELTRFHHKKSQIEEIVFRVMPSIRKFVANGGGYVGSCYGICKSSNIWFSQYNRIIIPTLKIAGILILPNSDDADPDNYYVEQKIMNDSHPVTYGIGRIVTSFRSSFNVKIIGKNSQAIARYHQGIRESLIDKPSWISNSYGDGKVISFAGHPEIMAFLEEEFNGRHVVSNTWFHLTNRGIYQIKCDKNVNNAFISNIFENTSNLVNNSIETSILFDGIKDCVKNSISLMDKLKTKILKIQSIVNRFNSAPSFIQMNKTIRRIIGEKYSSGGINLSKYYLEEINDIINSIEDIYPLFKNNTYKNESRKTFIKNIISRLQYIDNLTYKAQDWAENSEESLKKYENNNLFFPKIREQYINNVLLKARREISDVFVMVSQIYHDSLKFLRHNWYEYETNYFLEQLGD